MTLYTTLALLREHRACGQDKSDGRYQILVRSLPAGHGDDDLIDLLHILGSNGVDDCLWSLRAVIPDQATDRDRIARHIACDFAEAVLWGYEKQYLGDTRVRDCIAVARRYTEGRADRAELNAAWSAWCIGDRTEVARLLTQINGIGKRRNVGFGEVCRWVVEPAEFTMPEMLVREGCLTRSIPVGAEGLIEPERTLLSHHTELVAWTPPYWLSGLLRPGWRVGNTVAYHT